MQQCNVRVGACLCAREKKKKEEGVAYDGTWVEKWDFGYTLVTLRILSKR